MTIKETGMSHAGIQSNLIFKTVFNLKIFL